MNTPKRKTKLPLVSLSTRKLTLEHMGVKILFLVKFCATCCLETLPLTCLVLAGETVVQRSWAFLVEYGEDGLILYDPSIFCLPFTQFNRGVDRQGRNLVSRTCLSALKAIPWKDCENPAKSWICLLGHYQEERQEVAHSKRCYPVEVS